MGYLCSSADVRCVASPPAAHHPPPMSSDLAAIEPNAQVIPPQAAKQEKKQRISKRVAQAIELLVSGECRYQKDAAERANITPEHLCKALKKPTVRVFYERAARESIAAGTMRASARLIGLLDASSEHVSFDAAKHVLGIAGIKPTADAQVSVNVEIKAGYVIDLTGRQKTEPGTQLKEINGLTDEKG